jgi:hypothetical protein
LPGAWDPRTLRDLGVAVLRGGRLGLLDVPDPRGRRASHAKKAPAAASRASPVHRSMLMPAASVLVASEATSPMTVRTMPYRPSSPPMIRRRSNRPARFALRDGSAASSVSAISITVTSTTNAAVADQKSADSGEPRSSGPREWRKWVAMAASVPDASPQTR